MTKDVAPVSASPASARKLRVGAWCRSLALEQMLRDEANDVALTVVPKPAGANPAAASWADECDVLIVDVDLKDTDEFVLLSRLLEMRGPRRPVIATAANAALDDVRRLMRTGLADFLPQPVNRADLQHSLTSISNRLVLDDAGPRRGTVATFMRAGGGAGATTLATHVAIAAAAKTPQRKVAFLDLDLQRGAAALHLDIGSDVGVVHCLERFPDIEPGFIDSVASKHATGVDVFVANANRWPLDDYAPEAIGSLIDVARKVYDLVVVDTPPVWTRWHRALLERTDLALVVTQKSVSQLRLARGLLGVLQDELRPDQIAVVCNRERQNWFGGDITRKEVEKALGRGVDFAVPNEFAVVSEAANLGVPASHVKSGSKFEKATIALAEEIDRRIARRAVDAAGVVAPVDAVHSTGQGVLDEARRVAG